MGWILWMTDPQKKFNNFVYTAALGAMPLFVFVGNNRFFRFYVRLFVFPSLTFWYQADLIQVRPALTRHK